MRLKPLDRIRRVVDERKARALATTVLRPEAEAGDLVLGGLVEFGQLVAELVLADVLAVGVEDITDNKVLV